jgi:hypothetical protein
VARVCAAVYLKAYGAPVGVTDARKTASVSSGGGKAAATATQRPASRETRAPAPPVRREAAVAEAPKKPVAAVVAAPATTKPTATTGKAAPPAASGGKKGGGSKVSWEVDPAARARAVALRHCCASASRLRCDGGVLGCCADGRAGQVPRQCPLPLPPLHRSLRRRLRRMTRRRRRRRRPQMVLALALALALAAEPIGCVGVRPVHVGVCLSSRGCRQALRFRWHCARCPCGCLCEFVRVRCARRAVSAVHVRAAARALLLLIELLLLIVLLLARACCCRRTMVGRSFPTRSPKSLQATMLLSTERGNAFGWQNSIIFARRLRGPRPHVLLFLATPNDSHTGADYSTRELTKLLPHGSALPI